MKPLSRLLPVVVLGGALALLSTAVSTQQPVPGPAGVESRRRCSRLHPAGQRRPDLLAQQAQGQVRRPRLVPQSIHRRLNCRMPGAP